MIKFFPRLIFVSLCGFVGARAAALTQDLGQGLSYYRAHALPAELPSADVLNHHPSVLDLRYATGDSSAATALAGWLKFHSAPSSPVFVLVNADTSSALLTVLSRRERIAGLVVLGAASIGFTPDIVLAIAPEIERRAYDAFENGVALDSLLNPPIEKPRNDEAKLARDRQPVSTPQDSDTVTAPSGDTEVAAAKPPSPPPLVDPVLQRAVHLHRALLALKKI